VGQKGPPIVVTHGGTGEMRSYATDDGPDADEAFTCIDEHFKWIARARRNLNRARHEEHIRLMQTKAVEYVEAPGFQGSYSAVFLLMLGMAKYGGRVPLTRQQIEERLGYSRQTVTRAIRHLVENGMVTESEHEGRAYWFLPSPAAQKGRRELKKSRRAVRTVRQRAAERGLSVVPDSAA